MRAGARPPKLRGLLQALLFATFLYHPCFPEANKQGEPFNTFRSLDAKLSLLDAQFGQLRNEISQLGKVRDPKRRTKALKKLRNLENSRQIRSTVSSITVTVRALAAHDAMRKSRYGRVLGRGLTRRATFMKRSLHQVMVAKTYDQTDVGLRKFSDALLAFVLQFQAVSGGYGALQCGPGDWTCCGRKKVRTTGKATLNGCMWRCVKRRRTCKSGCLGPRTPLAARPDAIPEWKATAARRPRSL